MKKISVVIPAYNEEKYIGKCLSSLGNQTLPRKNYEIIVINDKNSIDRTGKIAKKYADRVVNIRERVLGKVRDIGFRSAKGEIIASTDADTTVPKNWLELIVKSLGSKAVGVYGPVLISDSGVFPNKLSKLFFTPFLNLTQFIGRPNLSGMNFAVKKEAVEEIGYFNTELKTCEDIDLGYRLAKIGNVIFNKDLIVYTSMRRIKKYGYARFVAHHMSNYLRYQLTGSAHKYVPVR